MTSPPSRTPRRTDALSRDRIVEATVELLDAADESELTVRALTARLATGRGAIYHHVAGKDELLAMATDHVIGHVIAAAKRRADAPGALRALGLGIFDAIDAHPWVGRQLGREPSQPAVFRLWGAVGGGLQDLGITGPALADAGSALVNYVLGAAAQHAGGAGRTPDPAARQAHLDRLAAQLASPDGDPLARQTADLLRDHDDRAQFLAGVDIFLAGVMALSASTPGSSPATTGPDASTA